MSLEQKEWLDVVDENDEVVGRATRDEVHRDNLLHRSAHILLLNSKNQIFVQLRSLLKDNSPGLWDTSAAGHVDSGESYLQCAIRELAEELGVELAPDDLVPVGRLPPERSNGFEFTQIYTAHSDQPLTLQAEEVDDGRWVSVDELDRWICKDGAAFTGTFLTIWAKVKPITP
ncbi:MAG: NUDIX domain-containing protein [Granulosicoccus sp.]